MRYRGLILGSLLAFIWMSPGVSGADDQFPPPPVLSDAATPTTAASTAPAPPALPDNQTTAQPPAPPVPPQVSDSTPTSASSAPAPPMPSDISSTAPPAAAPSTAPAPPPVPEQPSIAPPDIATGAVSQPLPTPSTESPAPPPPPEVSATSPSSPSPTPLTTPPPVSATTAAPPVPPSATPALNAYDQALSLFKQKQYQDAIPLFKQANAQKPGDAKLYYYLGSCQYKAGHTRDAVVSLGIACKLKPDVKLQDFVRRLRAPLSFQEKQWADAQIDAYGTGKTPDVPAPVDYPQFGLRLEPQISFFNLSEFTADVQSQSFYAGAQLGADPSYRFSANVPTGLIGYIAEPVLRMDSHLEFGLPLSYLPVGTITENIQSNLYGNSSMSYALSAMVGGLDVRLLTGDRPLQFFASIGPRLASIAVNVNYSNPSGSGASDFSSVAFGGEAQVGLDWEFAGNFLFSPSIGYRWLQSGRLTGNISSGGQNTLSRLEYAPNPSGGPEITVVPEAGPDPTGESPLKADLSGVTGGLTLSALF